MGCMSAPLTEILEKRGKVAFFSFLQKDLISRSVPGSCPLKLLAGNARTWKPLAVYFFWSDSRLEYCGPVSPHLLATLTTRSTWFLNLPSATALPSMSFTLS